VCGVYSPHEYLNMLSSQDLDMPNMRALTKQSEGTRSALLCSLLVMPSCSAIESGASAVTTLCYDLHPSPQHGTRSCPRPNICDHNTI
jgi:hypothetical protein